MIQKPGTPSNLPTKTLIFNWIKTICPDSSLKLKVEDLGDGVVYCKIINHYFSNIISVSRLAFHPKNQYQNSLNLKLFQNALTQLKINIPFDVSKVAKQKFLQNWSLINSLYKHLVLNNQENSIAGNSNQDSRTQQAFNPYKVTPKRTFQFAFSDQVRGQQILHSFGKTNPNIHYQAKNTGNSIYPISQPHRQNIIQKPIYGNSLYSQHYNFQKNHPNNVQSNRSIIHNQQDHLNQSNNNYFTNQNFSRHPLSNKDCLIQNNYQTQKSWSVGKIYKENNSLNDLKHLNHNQGKFSVNEGKHSVNSHIFQSNYSAVIDRVKEILLKASHDIQKIRQIKMLLNIPLNQQVVKVEEQQILQQKQNENKNLLSIPTKQSIQLPQTNKILKSQDKFAVSECEINKFLQNSNKQELNQSKKVIGLQCQTSGKKIRNNWKQNSFFMCKK